MILQLAFCIFFQRGDGRNGRVRCGWGQIRFSLPFAVFLTCIIAPDWYRVYNIQRSCRKSCIFVFLSLFLTERLPNQHMSPKVKIPFTNKSWNANKMCFVYVQGIEFSPEVQSLLAFLTFIVLSPRLNLSS